MQHPPVGSSADWTWKNNLSTRCWPERFLNGGGHVLCSKHYCVTIWSYLLGVLDDKLTAEISFSGKSACAPNTGVLNWLWFNYISWLNIYCSAPLACIILTYTHILGKKKQSKEGFRVKERGKAPYTNGFGRTLELKPVSRQCFDQLSYTLLIFPYYKVWSHPLTGHSDKKIIFASCKKKKKVFAILLSNCLGSHLIN